jgi:regulator of telomere elongation helicase 1
MCPYYLAREMQSEADIIFMPYNYILDIKTRKMHNINIQGAIIILDEAHNIERVCEESASFDLTSTDISLCIGDVDTILKAKKEEQEFSSTEDEIGEDLRDFLNLKAFFLSLEDSMDRLEISSSSKGVVKPGQFMFEFLSPLGLTPTTCSTLLSQCGKAIAWLTAESRSFRTGSNIEKFMDAITVVFSHSGMGPPQAAAHNYKVFMKAEEAKKTKKSDVWTVPAAETSSKKQTRTLSYWCFSPGYAMTDLTAQGVRSIVLTSGTLSPLDSFSSELHIDFPVRYEGPHVISKQQVWVGVVSRGCDGAALNSSYEKRSTASYQSSLGNTIVNFARIVPQGVLVFFPSYPVMHSCMDYWRENGILQRMEQYKPYFQEPRRKGDFNPTMDAFYDAINDPKKDGAIFFAVCRGKVSEGLDFANNNGRAVIITGLPYPPRMDPKVDLKMKYLEESRKSSHTMVLGGQEWYKQQASRAVNQAVGRVIRHRHDYGAIILCDERFAYRNTISQLPKWVRPFVQTYDKFGLIQRDLTQFFRNAEKQFGGMAPKKSVVRSSEVSCGEGGTSSSRGYRGPIAMRENSLGKSRAVDPQDASLVETHLVNRTAQASLTKLRGEQKPQQSKSLFSSLEQVEVGSMPSRKTISLHREPEDHKRAGPSFSQTILCCQGSECPTSTASGSVGRPKKMLVVSKKHKQADKVASIAGFIDEIRDNLSDQAYTSFKAALAAYKKVPSSTM